MDNDVIRSWVTPQSKFNDYYMVRHVVRLGVSPPPHIQCVYWIVGHVARLRLRPLVQLPIFSDYCMDKYVIRSRVRFHMS